LQDNAMHVISTINVNISIAFDAFSRINQSIN